ncbi:MAG TPA: right-handed parallel beta-helix repeat-containing protein [Candidatus Eisenbacteria bacterium]|nr:right-handed parallel beta-helix repeat-containing protein [Candidatus Eisenbacteria bacterium]
MGPLIRAALPRAARLPGLAVLLALGATLPGIGSANTLTVPGQYPSVRTAVNAAKNGDIVLVAPGTWPGGVFINNKVVTIASWYQVSGDTSWVSQTILSGVASGTCTGHSGQGCVGNAVLEYGANADSNRVVGLTLANGENGVASSSTVDISHCYVVHNGDGVDFVDGAGGTFDHNLFEDNSDDGVDLNGPMNLTVRDNIIRNNGDDGIEYRLHDYTGPVTQVDILDNRITGNGEDGVQIIDYSALSDYVVDIRRNYFSANYDGSGSSAAIGCMGGGNTIENVGGAQIPERIYVVNNTFVNEKHGIVGGANLIAMNNIFTGTQVMAIKRVMGNSIVSYAMLWNNVGDYATSVVDTLHVIRANPMLKPDGRLMAGSPAIETGTMRYIFHGDTVLVIPISDFISLPEYGAFEYLANIPPVVNAGADRIVTFPASAHLAAAVSDDGNEWAEGQVALTWSVVSGPGPVTFDAPGAPSTQASFTVAGVYVLALSAYDGELAGADSLTVTVLPTAPAVERRIAAAGDDAEEAANGTLSTLTGALELVHNVTDQTVGLRFTAVPVPPGSTITGAWIQFAAGPAQSGAANLLFRAQAADNPLPFASTFANISGRPRTAAGVAWAPQAWSVAGEAGDGQRTPDLSPVVQEVVGRPGWASGNPMVFVITGTGVRSAVSYEGGAANAALLHIEYAPAVTGVGGTAQPGPRLLHAGAHPARRLSVEFSLAGGAPATLAIVDVTGRVRHTREVGSLGAGRHRLEVRQDLPVGVYFLRLVEGRTTTTLKAVVLD